MNTLLPLNAKPIELALDSLATHQLDMDLTPIDIHPLSCDEKLLPILAAEWRVDISGLAVPEQRRLINNAREIHRYRGTVYAVEKALDVVFDNAEVIEHQRPFEFDAKVQFKADTEAVYDHDKFSVARKLANQAKNGRSSFVNFDIQLPESELDINHQVQGAIKPALNTSLTLTGNSPVVITGAIQWML